MTAPTAKSIKDRRTYKPAGQLIAADLGKYCKMECESMIYCLPIHGFRNPRNFVKSLNLDEAVD